MHFISKSRASISNKHIRLLKKIRTTITVSPKTLGRDDFSTLPKSFNSFKTLIVIRLIGRNEKKKINEQINLQTI